MTFRTPSEAVALANNTQYGLAASVWTENINLALDIAPKLKAGMVWINCTNLFDAASGFGGYRESGFGREGGREGMWEYAEVDDATRAARRDAVRRRATAPAEESREARSAVVPSDRVRRVLADPPSAIPPIDRTPKLYIGGKQVAPRLGLQPPGARCRRAAASAK